MGGHQSPVYSEGDHLPGPGFLGSVFGVASELNPNLLTVLPTHVCRSFRLFGEVWKKKKTLAGKKRKNLPGHRRVENPSWRRGKWDRNLRVGQNESRPPPTPRRGRRCQTDWIEIRMRPPRAWIDFSASLIFPRVGLLSGITSARVPFAAARNTPSCVSFKRTI